jgi:hypothetical protein
MKEAFAGVLAGFQGLGNDDSRERPIDRLGALGAIQIKREEQGARGKQADRTAALSALGVRLIAFKFGNCASSKADAEDMLAGILAWKKREDDKPGSQWGLKLSGRERTSIAAWTVHEFAIDLCPSCKGAKQVPTALEVEGTQPMAPCQPCGATGKRRYNDTERAAFLGSPYSKAMTEAHGIVGRAESLALEGSLRMLEKWRPKS